jgi:hypothetical protein
MAAAVAKANRLGQKKCAGRTLGLVQRTTQFIRRRLLSNAPSDGTSDLLLRLLLRLLLGCHVSDSSWVDQAEQGFPRQATAFDEL